MGLYDMHGNVEEEWVQDWYAVYPGAVVDPVGPAGGVVRVLRGGGYSGQAELSRSACPEVEPPNSRGGSGLRPVISPALSSRHASPRWCETGRRRHAADERPADDPAHASAPSECVDQKALARSGGGLRNAVDTARNFKR